MTGEELALRSQELMEQLSAAPSLLTPRDRPPLRDDDDDDLASEELTVAVNVPEVPGPLP
ncbi:MAG TPA: hypothetical protein VN193_06935 [Candidatus Angelobacter sp.]|nr:hypothetical protein [Candidatus Angelobacter sp.]